MTLIANLIYSNVLKDLTNNRYECLCGSIIVKNTIYKHIQTNKHITHTTCDVCMNENKYTFKCPHCNNKHCLGCHTDQIRCPSCLERTC